MTDKELTSVLALTELRSAKFKSARTRPLRVSKKSFPRTQRTWNMVSNFHPKFSTKTILFLSKWEFYEPCFAETFFAIFLRGYRHRCKRSNLQLLRPENLPLWLTEQFSFPIDNKSISFDQYHMNYWFPNPAGIVAFLYLNVPQSVRNDSSKWQEQFFNHYQNILGRKKNSKIYLISIFSLPVWLSCQLSLQDTYCVYLNC